jgi:hypothetical protein
MVNEILHKYLQAIDVATVKDIEEGKTVQVTVHQGYYATVRRFIENRNRITLRELYRILSLYSIDEIPDIETLSTAAAITIVPQPSIFVSDVITQPFLQFVPQPNLVIVRAVEVTSVPQTNVIVIMPLTINYVPQALVSVDRGSEIIGLPQPSLFVDNITPPPPEITIIHQPNVEQINSVVIMHINQPSVQMTEGTVESDEYYWGFAPYATSTPRSDKLAYMQINQVVGVMLNATNYATQGFLQKQSITSLTNLNNLLTTDWQANLPLGEQAYLVFLIPSTLQLRTEWINSSLGSGPIGGVLDESIAGNHWPDPNGTITYNGRTYHLYLGNRPRRVSGNLNLIR